MSSLPVLSFRTDSLLVQCVISAAIFYVPQDAAALIGAYWVGSTLGRKKVGAGEMEFSKLTQPQERDCTHVDVRTRVCSEACV